MVVLGGGAFSYERETHVVAMIDAKVHEPSVELASVQLQPSNVEVLTPLG